MICFVVDKKTNLFYTICVIYNIYLFIYKINTYDI